MFKSKFAPLFILATLVALGVHAADTAPAEPPKADPAPAPESNDNKVYHDNFPFRQNFWMEFSGTVLMFVLIALSNAGGLSGGGTNIPIMLIFFEMGMKKAVPISGFVAVVSTVFRFILNYSQKHPTHCHRSTINYEVIMITMPAVFLGSFIGVKINQAVSSEVQAMVFAITVAWSIQTTWKKARQLIEKENKASEEQSALNEQILEKPEEKQVQIQAETPELSAILHEESNHFTLKRVVFTTISFVNLFATQMIFKMPDLSMDCKCLVFATFFVITVALTVWSCRYVQWVNEIKERDGYSYCPNDLIFKSYQQIVFLAVACMVAAIICGMTGIAGGMVLGPLFLTYNMLPTVMSATNQYITMIASISVVIQFVYLGQLDCPYAALFGVVAFIAAFIGIKGVNIYMQKHGGKQSVITVILTVVLIFALLSLPLHFYLKSRMATVPTAHRLSTL